MNLRSNVYAKSIEYKTLPQPEIILRRTFKSKLQTRRHDDVKRDRQKIQRNKDQSDIIRTIRIAQCCLCQLFVILSKLCVTKPY